MDPKIKEDWVEALRSGEYVQGKNWLNAADRFCCLGVLCEVAGEVADIGIADHTKLYDGRADMLSERLLKHFGLSSFLASNLASLNDNGTSFDEIADYIEAEL